MYVNTYHIFLERSGREHVVGGWFFRDFMYLSIDISRYYW